MDHDARTDGLQPTRTTDQIRWRAGVTLVLASLDAWLAEHRDVEVAVPSTVGPRMELLSNLSWVSQPTTHLPWDQQRDRMPLGDILAPWWEWAAPQLTDDGVEVLLALPALSALSRTRQLGHSWYERRRARERQVDALADPYGVMPVFNRLRMPELASLLLPWLATRHLRPDWIDSLLDTAETVLARIPPELVSDLSPVVDLLVDQRGPVQQRRRFDWRTPGVSAWVGAAMQVEALCPQLWSTADRGRLWRLVRFLDEPAGRYDPRTGKRDRLEARRSPWHTEDTDLPRRPARHPPPLRLAVRAVEDAHASESDVTELLVGERVDHVDGGGSRDDRLPALTRRRPPQWLAAHPWLVRIIEDIGKAVVDSETTRGELATPFTELAWQLRGLSGAETVVRLLSTLHGGTLQRGHRWYEWSTATHAREASRAGTLSRLIRLCFPAAGVSSGPPDLGDAHLDALFTVARYASSGGGHKRAERYAQALRGVLDRQELITRITTTRHQDSVRALGLLPLPDDAQQRRAELLHRYEILQEFRRQSRSYGQKRRASEDLAVRIGMDNLARTAGYRDPQRLAWAMEAEAVRDLAAGPAIVTIGDVTVSLSLDDLGAPRLDVRRGERPLKSVPSSLRTNDRVAELAERAKALRQQARRVRRSLEEASVRGDRFAPDELAELMVHPMLRNLLLVTDEGVVGLPREGGRTLGTHDGTSRPVDSRVRVAHPSDLLASKLWPQWQSTLFDRRVRQPFKQVFRELYVPVVAERGDTAASSRYAGHQVDNRRASALLTERGWLASYDEGAVRTFHDEKLTARLTVLDGSFTPAGVEGLTLDIVSFAPADARAPLPLEQVPPRLFSEVMRDIDLVVSLAHAGGVDPEASASTVDMRRALVEQTASLLRLDSVELTAHHALITGKLGSYSVHLGSGLVHRRPGNAVCIIPVGSQHRGRLFLPFADDDPRTAEVVSKVLLLARDDRIRDPTILEQLRL